MNKNNILMSKGSNNYETIVNKLHLYFKYHRQKVERKIIKKININHGNSENIMNEKVIFSFNGFVRNFRLNCLSKVYKINLVIDDELFDIFENEVHHDSIQIIKSLNRVKKCYKCHKFIINNASDLSNVPLDSISGYNISEDEIKMQKTIGFLKDYIYCVDLIPIVVEYLDNYCEYHYHRSWENCEDDCEKRSPNYPTDGEYKNCERCESFGLKIETNHVPIFDLKHGLLPINLFKHDNENDYNNSHYELHLTFKKDVYISRIELTYDEYVVNKDLIKQLFTPKEWKYVNTHFTLESDSEYNFE